MRPTIRLTAMPDETHFAPLGVLGYCLTRTHFLEPVFESVRLPFKTVVHSPTNKLLDVLVSILAGCRSIRPVNTWLRPDLALAQAWGRERFAEQATLARTLDGFTVEQIAQLRHGSERLFRRESRTLRHPFAEDWLWLDIDLTPLPASKHAEASTCSDLQSKTLQPAIIATFRPELSATEMRLNRNYLQLNLQSNAPNLQSSGSNRHYLQLKIWTWTGPENDRLLDAVPAATRSTPGVACHCPETQPRKQRPSLGWKDEFLDSVSVANNVGLPAMIAG